MHNNRQQGFTIGTVLFVTALLIIVYGAAQFVIRINRDNQKQANLLTEAAGGSSQAGSDPNDFEIPQAPSTAREKPLRSVSVLPDTLHVILEATLPGVYSGTCVAELSQVNGPQYIRFVEPFEAAGSCRITIPNERLRKADWKYKMSYFTSDGRYRGEYPEARLGL